jgi:glycosyltransferase involved in cell wall biosynthesis
MEEVRAPLRVARVIAKLEPGGAQLGAFRLSQALRRHGIESRLLAGDATPEGIALAREHGLDVEAFADGTAPRRGAAGGPDLQWTPSELFAAWLAPRLAGADLVHAHMLGAWWAAAQVVPDEVPLLASEHNALNWPGRPQRRAARQGLRRVDRFFAHGPAARSHILALGLPAERLFEGRSAIAGAGARPRPELPAPRLVFTGRLAPDKGPDLLLEALARLPAPPPTFILGEGRMRPALERRAKTLGLGRTVTFAGWQPEPGSWVAGASALVVPSREEAWSQSAVLAMALGTPVVACAVEGLPAVLADGRGVLVAPGDAAALGHALEDVLAGRHTVDVAAARAYAATFTLARLGREYAAHYRSACRNERALTAGEPPALEALDA